MRIALVNPPLTGHEIRGTGIYTQNLLKALRDIPGVEVVLSGIQNIPSNADLFHFPYFDPFFLTLPIIRAKKTVVTVHDLIPLKFPEHFPRGIRGDVKWRIQRFIIRGVDAIITDSKSSAKDVILFTGFSKSKIFPIYLAAAADFFETGNSELHQQVIEKYNLPSKFALYVGDMNWNKNAGSAIKAATEARIPLVIVSKSFVERHDQSYNPWKESLLEAQVLARNNDLIYKIGHINIEELVGLYKSATCLIFPSYYEGFGIPVVEAFAAGCPVITSDKGSLAEIAGDAACVVDPKNISNIVAALKKISSDSIFRKKLIVKGKLQVKYFSWSETARQTLQVYKTVLGIK